MGAIEKFVIEGDKKGGGGGSGGFSEDPNTLRSLTTVRVLEVISEGECEGFPLSPEGQCIFFNDTQIQNADGTFNFSNVKFDSRVGLPSQPYMAGFPTAEAPFSLSATLTQATPVIQSISSADIDAVRITIQLPNGLSNQDTTNGGIKGYSVQIAIDVRDQGGSWTQVESSTISGKTMSAYERDYRVNRPSSAGLWDFRVRRITADELGANIRAQTAVSRFTEIQDVKEEYNDCAYVGVQVDAQATGGSIPTRSYLYRGIKCQVPSNYDPITRAYTGQWNGVFQTAWTDNPAWILYDLLTNVRYGLGEFVVASQVDKFSFYNAAIYNDELVPDGNDGFEPRYRFNGVISTQEEALKVIQAIAGVMRATVIYSGGVIWLNQDRPSSAVKLVTKANVIDGIFTYTSTPLQARHTVAHVTWYDKNNKYLPTPSTIEDTDGIARYGYNSVDLTALGTVTEGQAIRLGKWYLDKELNTTEVVTYKSSINQFDLMLGDVIKVYDEDFTDTVGAGRIVSASNTYIELDRPVELNGTSFIDIIGNDGKSIHTYQLNESSGSYKTVTPIALHTLSEIPNVNADYIITSAVSPRQFRVIEVNLQNDNTVSISAAFYDPTQYARIEQGISIAVNPYTVIEAQPISAPTGFGATVTSYVDAITGPHTALIFSWIKPPENYLSGYDVMWRKDGGAWSSTSFITTEDYTIERALAGNYELSVIAKASTGVSSLASIASYLYGYTGVNSLFPPATLQQSTTASLTFNTNALSVIWTNDARNNAIAESTLNGWLLKIYNNDTNTLLRAVSLGKDTLDYTYSHDSNIADGGPARNIRVDAYSVDVFGNLSTTIKSVIFSNPSPAVPNNLVVTGVSAGVKITYDKPADSDYEGVLIWGSTTSGFAPSESNLLFEGDSTIVSLTGLDTNTSYYYKVAAYDSFAKNYTGSGLNVSGEIGTSTLAGPGITQVSTLPLTANEDDIVYLSTTKMLYHYSAGSWVAVVGDILTNSVTAVHLDAINAVITGVAQLGTAVVTTAAVQDAAITNAKIESITADKIQTGTLAASQSISVGSSVVIDGAGQITTDGPNSKTVITDGNVVSYKKVGASLYAYKSLNHMESGVADNNSLVTIPGYFLNQPNVLVSPANMQFYNPSYSNQAQSIVCSAGAVTQTATGSSVWQFTPAAQLTLASGNGSTTVNAGSGDISSNSWTSNSYVTAANCTSITPNVSLKSVRGNGVSQYYYRSIRWRVEYYNGSTWITTDGFRIVNMGAQTTTAQNDSKTFTFPSTGTWTWRIYTEEYDTDGSVFGSVAYTYSQTTCSASTGGANYDAANSQYIVTATQAASSKTLSIPINVTGSGEIYEITYNYQHTISMNWSSTLDSAHGYVTDAIEQKYRWFSYPNQLSYMQPRSQVVSGSNLSVSNIQLTLGRQSGSGEFVSISLKVPTSTISAVVKRRTAVANSTTPVNNSLLNSYNYALSSAQVLATGTLNWIAIGD